jgi:hypothetical protein
MVAKYWLSEFLSQTRQSFLKPMNRIFGMILPTPTTSSMAEVPLGKSTLAMSEQNPFMSFLRKCL